MVWKSRYLFYLMIFSKIKIEMLILKMKLFKVRLFIKVYEYKIKDY